MDELMNLPISSYIYFVMIGLSKDLGHSGPSIVYGGCELGTPLDSYSRQSRVSGGRSRQCACRTTPCMRRPRRCRPVRLDLVIFQKPCRAQDPDGHGSGNLCIVCAELQGTLTVRLGTEAYLGAECRQKRACIATCVC